MSVSLKCLRPCLLSSIRPASLAVSSSYLRFYSVARADVVPKIPKSTTSADERPQELWPRVKASPEAVDCQVFKERYQGLEKNETLEGEEVVVRGRIWSSRALSSKFGFFDLFQDNHIVQCMLNFADVSKLDITPKEIKNFLGGLRRGDVYSVRGLASRTSSGELSVKAVELPQLLSRCMQPLPTELKNQELRMRNRHVDFLVNRETSDKIRLRSEIVKFLRQYLEEDGHVEVQTPILADIAGGAAARPFNTSATEFEDRQLSLRIAPELWLKRLILGGFEKVYEIGPCFRNEGIDLGHNPEFWTCEFYRTYTDLDELLQMTENMFLRLSKITAALKHTKYQSLEAQVIINTSDTRPTGFTNPFRRIDFIPEIEKNIGEPLPDLKSPDAESKITQLLIDHSISLPTSPTLPSLLDKLSAEMLEHQCTNPTWIINHPECLAPLSKSFVHPQNGQCVSARAELFVDQQELVNTYEEENSPLEQRRKFEEQIRYRDVDSPEMIVDESYLQALEWGMPPTGGWGCGIERICMLFGGTRRIADVLSFGTLRNVVSRGSRKQNTSNTLGDDATPG